MSKLHEVLAVEGELEGRYSKIFAESHKIFENKHNLFIGAIKSYESLTSEDQETVPDEHMEMATTVPERLQYTFDSAVAYFDNLIKKEATNQTAKGDIEIDYRSILFGSGEVIAGEMVGVKTIYASGYF